LNRIGQPSCGNASFTRLEGVADFDGMMNTALTITKFAQVAATNSACVTRARHVRLGLHSANLTSGRSIIAVVKPADALHDIRCSSHDGRGAAVI
jgi:hypothetical protein